jgi:hypothetical protein
MRTALRARAAALLIETQVARSEPQASGVDPAGAPAPRFCSACGAGVRARDAFCSQCGNKLQVSREPQASEDQ